MLRSLKQYNKNTALTHARADARSVCLQQTWSTDDQLATFESISAADIDAFSLEWFKRAQVVVLVTGNMTLEEVRALTITVQDIFQLAPLLPAEQPTARCIDLAPTHTYLRQMMARNPDDTNSCTFNMYQIGVATLPLEAHAMLLSHFLSDALFDQLRTKETLGYLVQGFQGRTAGVLHYHVAVQSSDADAAYLNYRVEGQNERRALSLCVFAALFCSFPLLVPLYSSR